jgi:hypothetical protein
MTISMNKTKRFILGLFLTLSGMVIHNNLAAHAPGGPVIDEKSTWEQVCDSAKIAGNFTYKVGSATCEAVYAGIDAAYTGARFVQKASIFTYLVAKRSLQTTVWAFKKSYDFCTWACNRWGNYSPTQAFDSENGAGFVVAPARLF